MSDPTQFESRKKEHLKIALSPESQTPHLAGFDRVRLAHEALPDLDFSKVDISSTFLKDSLKTPFLVSSMTAGHGDAVALNAMMARVAEARGWMMGVGSQRRELFDAAAKAEWREVRKAAPRAVLLGNLGIAQVIQTPVKVIRELVDNLEAQAFFVHLNPLQECLQPEGNTDFTGSFTALAKLVKEIGVPVVIKETGCGFSEKTLRRLNETGALAIDVAGTGGTHWGRVEGLRSPNGGLLRQAAETYRDWGYSTLESLSCAKKQNLKAEIWASGGVRSGLDAAKLLAMGAQKVGFAKPVLEAALKGERDLDETMARFEFELKVAMFCSGHGSLQEFQNAGVWEWI
ncbi:MAG: type 2 isopentenyl-diphosphate Delta-isomerase [Bdellovibrionaceae bacterium]|nr:type 2 isopentenyl-diphosphate Delta-isomerase [Pseudobdellovibrionaceae bacterium]